MIDANPGSVRKRVTHKLPAGESAEDALIRASAEAVAELMTPNTDAPN